MSRRGSTGTLLLTTLISIVGWIMVTLYTNNNLVSDQVHKLAIKVNTLEVSVLQNKSPEHSQDFYILKESIGKVSVAHEKFEVLVTHRLRAVNTRINTIIMRGTNESGDAVTLTYEEE